MNDLKHGSDNPDGPKTVPKAGWFGTKKRTARSNGDLEILSVTTFFWIVDRCVPFLRFQIDNNIKSDYAKALDKIMQRAKDHPNTHGHYGGWGIAPIIDSYEGIMAAAGSEPRTPDHYLFDRGEEKEKEADHEEECSHNEKHTHKRTNEYMHPVVQHTYEQASDIRAESSSVACRPLPYIKGETAKMLPLA
ncbi:hypothetical protein BU23DRAFT_562661 [Bimuria novae-zelandiae CBS 107.79]|uniref:Uncharacterized protein n=1 Tax=Bimuria novae-zelandiae CBS 107.79 TaxID=1447943 RepID=A0A6A5VZI9_9PLEO|nr:hypothetical protein BU23DRAFT_562661 [Bimuria novae-zelandiae CBS 107.79]